VLDAAVYAARRRHPAVAYELVVTAGSSLLQGWGGGLRLLVDNLLDNAALHGRPGGRVLVSLARERDALVLRVDDDGPGVPPEERERLLEPFARGDGAVASGTGLGLAIVSQQAALHGGTVRLDGSPLGGLGAEVRLPASASAQPPAAERPAPPPAVSPPARA
jgi:two-component system sensor histidine kinase PrrB